jgi:hypothetical protein
MPVVVADKYRSPGTAHPSSLGEEVTLVSVSPQRDEYMVEGYVDLGNMENGDEVLIIEYIAVDGTNLRKFNSVTFNDRQDAPIIRIHTKTLDRTFKYKVTLTQTKGVIRDYPYAFIIEVLGKV